VELKERGQAADGGRVELAERLGGGLADLAEERAAEVHGAHAARTPPDDGPAARVRLAHQTPRQEIYKRNKSRLYRYESSRRHRTPVLFVPNLGISRPYIFDLLPGGSFIEHMTREGYDFYLLDWGVFGPEDNDLTFEDCVVKILPRVARKVLESSGAESLSVLGYCMGAPLAASFVASHPEIPVKNFINMAGPIDFSQIGIFGLWLDKKYFDVDRFVDTLGSVPADLVKAGFKLLKPTMDLSTNLNLWWNLWNDKYVEGFTALNKWANEYLPFPGEFFRQWVKEFYQQNKLVKGELVMGGRPVKLSAIACGKPSSGTSVQKRGTRVLGGWIPAPHTTTDNGTHDR